MVAEKSFQIINISRRNITLLDGQCKTIVDLFENGYYNYRPHSYDGGFAQDKVYTDRTLLQEYFDTDK